MTARVTMSKAQTEAIWKTFEPHFNGKSLGDLGMSSVSDLADSIRNIRREHTDEFNLSDHAIAYEVRHMALCMHVRAQKQVAA